MKRIAAVLTAVLNDTITNGFTAGGYPGLGNRTTLDDGHRASVVLTATPPG